MNNLRNNKVSVASHDQPAASTSATDLPQIDVPDSHRFEDLSLLIYKNNARLFADLNGRFSDEIRKMLASQQHVSQGAESIVSDAPRGSVHKKMSSQVNKTESTVCTII
jgi:hypothetical protein